MARPEKIRLGDLLVRENLITQDQLEFALERQRSNGHKLGRVLVENGFVSEERISEALAMQLNIPYINLKNYSINPKLVRLLPESQARRFHAIVLEENKGRLLVGMCDPTDFSALDEIARLARREVDVAVVTEGQLLQGIDRGYLRTEEISALARTGENAGKGAFAEFGDLVDSFGTDNPSVAGLLKSLFDDAMRLRATEIHIEPQDRRLMLRLRIDGVLHPQPDADVKMAPALVSRIKLMAGLDISENRLPQSGRVQVSGRDQAVDVRVSLIPTQYGESAVMRLLRRESVMPGLDKLGMLPGMLKRFREIIERGRGMVLVTGPEDSGRTTLLYAALAEYQLCRKKNRNRRRPGGIPDARYQSGSGRRENQAHVSARAAFRLAAGSGRNRGQRDARRGNCASRRTRGDDRPPCAVDNVCPRCRHCRADAGGNGHTSIHGRLFRPGSHCATLIAANLW